MNTEAEMRQRTRRWCVRALEAHPSKVRLWESCLNRVCSDASAWQEAAEALHAIVVHSSSTSSSSSSSQTLWWKAFALLVVLDWRRSLSDIVDWLDRDGGVQQGPDDDSSEDADDETRIVREALRCLAREGPPPEGPLPET